MVKPCAFAVVVIVEFLGQLVGIRALMKTGQRAVMLRGWAELSLEALEGEPDSAELKSYCTWAGALTGAREWHKASSGHGFGASLPSLLVLQNHSAYYFWWPVEKFRSKGSMFNNLQQLFKTPHRHPSPKARRRCSSWILRLMRRSSLAVASWCTMGVLGR